MEKNEKEIDANLLLENAELTSQNSDLQYKVFDLERKLRKREEVRTRIEIKVATFLTIASIAVGSAGTILIQDIAKINKGKTEISKMVYEICLTDFGYRIDSTAGYVFNIGTRYVSYEDALAVIEKRARAAGILDEDLYIGLSNIFTSDLAQDVVEKVDTETERQRCMAAYLESELESVRENGR